ncbi:toxin Bro [Paramuricea clavata]|uniref:Toxin Bro n=1 Tax=Paramuricea clavata TaxID=317549 RepID=A0A7D9D7L2_PARCT|nr:toxin Bro [Paramuricea clavata]
MEKLFRNQKLNACVRIIKKGEDVLFYAKDVARSLGYLDTKKAVKSHVWKEDKCTLGSTRKGVLKDTLSKGHPDTILITEQGLYQLIFGSELNTAKEFRRWVFTEVLPSIRKTGSYELLDRRSLRYNQMIIINETDLHTTVVSYIRDNYPEAVIVPGLGEYQDTVSRRCDAWKKGYKGGQPDIIIENPMGKYKGFAIEFKSPKGTGVISENQDIWLRKLSGIGYMTMISDDLVKTCIRINEYFSLKKTARKVAVKKVVCNTKTYRPRFKSDETQLNLRYLTSIMEDKPEQIQAQVTSEKKKDPKRVAAGKRLAAISKIAKERKRKLVEPKESHSSDNIITYVGVVIALISLVLAFKSHQRETKEDEPKHATETVEMSEKSKMTKEVYNAVLLTAGAVGISMASKKLLKEPLVTPENVKGMAKLAVSVSLSSLLVSYLKDNKYLPDDPFKT